MELIEGAIYECRNGKEIGLIAHRFFASEKHPRFLVEYAPVDEEPYENAQLESVDWRGYVVDEETPTGRDLIVFLDYLSDDEEGYLQ